MTGGSKRTKLVVLGLDGVPFAMLSGMADGGVMPNLKGLLSTGKMVPMTASLPEISSVSWSSLMTGTDAGSHGIFGFLDLDHETYEYRFPNFTDLAAPPFFADPRLPGRRHVVVNLPSTYPARPIDGVLISGFVALDLAKAVHPLTLLPMLRRSGYMLDVDAGKCHEHPDEFLADIHLAMSLRRQAVEYLWHREEWDVFMNVVTETDRFFHFFYEAWENEHHPRREELLRIFAEIDDLIGFFLAHPPPGTTLEWLIASDHGFTRMKREVYLTPLLARAGFYTTSTPGNGDLTGISEKTTAFALDPTRIHLHKRGVYRLGRVKPGDEGTLRRELTDLFESLTVEGEKVVRRVFFREEIFHGRYLEVAPDLVLLAEPGFDIKAGHTKSEVSAPSRFSGVHRWDDALLFCSQPALIPENPSVFHVRGLLEQLARPR